MVMVHGRRDWNANRNGSFGGPAVLCAFSTMCRQTDRQTEAYLPRPVRVRIQLAGSGCSRKLLHAWRFLRACTWGYLNKSVFSLHKYLFFSKNNCQFEKKNCCHVYPDFFIYPIGNSINISISTVINPEHNANNQRSDHHVIYAFVSFPFGSGDSRWSRRW